MVKKITVFLLSIYSISILSLLAANEPFPEDNNSEFTEMKKEGDEIMIVTEEFLLLMRAGKIHGIIPTETGWVSETSKLTQKYISMSPEFDTKQFQEEIRTCTDLFKIDAKKDPPSKKQIRSFLCKRKEKVELMSVYSLEDNKWKKVEEQKRTVPLNEKFDDIPKKPQ